MPLWGPSNGSEEVRLGEVPKEAMHSISLLLDNAYKIGKLAGLIIPAMN